MNGAHGRPIRKFNPGTLQSDDEVIRQFVVRQRELNIVLEVIRGNLDSPSCQHMLVVAPRGRGKTMLLSRVAAELRTNDGFSRHLFPVRFMEESQEIFTLADFWIESLFYLAQACAPNDPEHSRELLATHADLTARWNDTNIEERAHAAVLETADRLSKTLVLMVENLQALCGAVDDDFGWQLRKTLQSEPQIMLLATAISRFKGLDDAREPFFELFRIVNLEPLDTDECRRLWYMVSGDAGRRREIEPLRILTGGSPRLLVIVAEFARHRSLRQLLEDLVTLIDNHTEYFRGHLEILSSKTERRVYLAVIDLWQPSSTGEIAARARMDIRVVSALLGRLVDRGAVLMDGTGRKRWYAAAERLYSIYYKLRRERDDAAIVHYLIQFMTTFYSDDELAALAVRDRGEARLGISDAPDLQLEVAKVLVNKGLTHGQRGEAEQELAAYDAVVERFGDSDAPDILVAVARALVNKGLTHGQRGEAEQELAAYDAVVERFGDSDAPDILVAVARALVNKGITHGQRGEAEQALAAYDAVVERFGDSDAPDLQLEVAKALVNKGITHGQRGEAEQELAAYDAVVERFGDSDAPDLLVRVAKALFNKGITHGQRGEAEQELATYDAVVERFGDSDAPDILVRVASALVAKGDRQIKIGRAEEALRTSDELERRCSAFTDDAPVAFELWRAKWMRTHALLVQEQHQASLSVLRSVCAMFVVNSAPMLREMLVRVPTLIAAGAAARDVVEILSADRKTADAVAPLVVALRQLAGESVRASTEVLEVAADVRKRIEETRMAGRPSRSSSGPTGAAL